MGIIYRYAHHCYASGRGACSACSWRRVRRRRSSCTRRRRRPAARPPGAAAPAQPTFRVSVDLVTTDVIVRDQKSDQFVADLKADEFEVYEDGVKQQIASLVLTHGGRVYNVQAPPPAPVQEGIILPRNRPTNDAAGRVFLLFIDDLHLDFRSTPRTRDLLKRMLRLLIHEGDMFGIVSTGTSSISEQLTYDRQVLESAIARITGGGLKAEGNHRGHAGLAGADRTAAPRARRVLHRLRSDAQPREAAEPPQGRHLLQQRLRLQSVRDLAARGAGAPHARGERATTLQTRSVLPHAAEQPAAGRSRSRARARRADARRQPRQRHALHDRPARPGGRARTSTRKCPRRTGTPTCARRRTACACWPKKPAASPSSTRTTSTRRSSGSTPRRATTTCSATTRRTPIR